MNADYQQKERRVFYRYEEIDDTVCADDVEILSTIREGEEPASVEPGETAVLKDGFWRRQFGPNVTTKQRNFDCALGVVMPIVCLWIDPYVFKSLGVFGPSLLGTYRVSAYLLAVISVIAMAAWLTFGEKLKSLNGLVAGLFFAGSLISMILGIVLFPFSVIGIAILIGFLGFTPLLSAVVYSRNAVRAMRASEPYFEKQTLKYVAMLTGVFSLVLPWLANQAGK